MTIEKMKLTDTEYFEKMLLAKALKHPDERKKLKLSEHHFENEHHQSLYTKLISDPNATVEDILTESVRSPKIYGNYQFIRDITNFPIATAKGIVNDQIQIYEFYKKRVIDAKIEDYQKAPTSEKAIEISKTVDALEQLDLKGNNSKTATMTDIMDDLYGINKSTIIQTKYDALDDIISGFEPQQLNVLAARPSMGKTAFAIGLAHNIAEQGHEVLFLSLETTEKNVTQRLLSSLSKVDLYKFKDPQSRMSEDEIERVIAAMDVYHSVPLRVEEHANLTPNKLRRLINTLDPKKPAVVMIDYLTLMQADDRYNSRYEEVTSVSRELKMITQEKSNVTIIALAQLNRAVEQRKDKRPMMSDLRDSGQIEQDSSMIMMLYREDYQDTETDPNAPSTLEVIVTKNKDGGLGTSELEFYKNIQKIY